MLYFLLLLQLLIYTSYRQEIKRTFGVPFAASVIMGAVSFVIYHVIYKIWPHNTLVMLIAISIAVIVYFVLYLLLRGADNEEIYEFPMGVRIVKLGKKLKLLRE